MNDAANLAAERAAGLRALADMIEAHPEIETTYLKDSFHVWSARSAEDLATIARAGLEHGAKVSKDVTDKLYNLVLSFGPIKVEALGWRDQVCERVVVGTETVTQTVKDPDALAQVPEIEQTIERDIVEWRCQPLLTDAMAAGESA